MESGPGTPSAKPAKVRVGSRHHVPGAPIGGMALVPVLAVLLLVVLVATWWGGDDETPDPGTASATPVIVPPATPPARKAQASDGGQLRIVEQGFTQLRESVTQTLSPGHGPGRPERYMPVRAAIIVENTSRDQVAIAPNFIARYLDLAGKGVVEYAAKSDENTLSTDAIFPGARVGIAAFFNNSDTTVRTMTVRAVDAVWLPLADARRWVSPVTATNVRTIRSGSPKATIVAFTARSDYSEPRSAVANAIYRDSAGRIIGSSDPSGGHRQHFPAGTADGSITVTDWLPTNLDDSRTQVFLSGVG
ncbi:hypothetical protein I0C86_28400 [Plantactinospora sp. S1510]|uniref:DUF4352 domain-containing protein n=1 Tax=Plantactinospora alkalitolerans TaxID=2789879 RepID=A0ABS0H3Y6_9ACTN|nr:hypothetical protein [Plantactinospora alkalitolerans]MBF9132849.1 hypothetical protein [Plantactinospora alkalitolerans]